MSSIAQGIRRFTCCGVVTAVVLLHQFRLAMRRDAQAGIGNRGLQGVRDEYVPASKGPSLPPKVGILYLGGRHGHLGIDLRGEKDRNGVTFAIFQKIKI